MTRFGRWTIAAAVLLLAGGLAAAQEKSAARPKGTLPPNWAKLGLSDEQKAKIYAAQAEYRAKIDELRKEIRMLQQKERADMVKVLTDAQKARLRELLAEKSPGGASAAQEKKPDTKPAPK